MKTAQRMVNEAAKRAFPNTEVVDEDGNPLVVYHGTDADFNVFSRSFFGQNTDDNASDYGYAQTSHLGFWFNSSPDIAKKTFSKKAVSAFLNITDAEHFYSLDGLASMLGESSAEEYVDYLKDNDYDGVILGDEEYGGESYVALEPSQIKSADPVTYDDNGNVIPLSERFNLG